jgi:release factor glutamine methyltransferase
MPAQVTLDVRALGLLDVKPTSGSPVSPDVAYGIARQRLARTGMQVVGDMTSEKSVNDRKAGKFTFDLDVALGGVEHLDKKDYEAAIRGHVATTVVEAMGLGDKLKPVEGWNGRKLFVPDETVPPPTPIGDEFTTEVMPRYRDDIRGKKLLDLGTGSGILAVAGGLMGAGHITATDVNESALTAAKVSWAVNGLHPDQLVTYNSDVFDTLPENAQFDFIFTNPPVQPETDRGDGDYLFFNEAGPDGRKVLDKILLQGPDRLLPGGKIITTTTSRHGDLETDTLLASLLDAESISDVRRVIHRETPLKPEIYEDYFDYWNTRGTETGDLRIYERPRTRLHGAPGYSHVYQVLEISR